MMETAFGYALDLDQSTILLDKNGKQILMLPPRNDLLTTIQIYGQKFIFSDAMKGDSLIEEVDRGIQANLSDEAMNADVEKSREYLVKLIDSISQDAYASPLKGRNVVKAFRERLRPTFDYIDQVVIDTNLKESEGDFHQFILLFYQDRVWIIDPTYQQFVPEENQPYLSGLSPRTLPKVLVSELSELDEVLKENRVPEKIRSKWMMGLRKDEDITGLIKRMPLYKDMDLDNPVYKMVKTMPFHIDVKETKTFTTGEGNDIIQHEVPLEFEVTLGNHKHVFALSNYSFEPAPGEEYKEVEYTLASFDHPALSLSLRADTIREGEINWEPNFGRWEIWDYLENNNLLSADEAMITMDDQNQIRERNLRGKAREALGVWMFDELKKLLEIGYKEMAGEKVMNAMENSFESLGTTVDSVQKGNWLDFCLFIYEQVLHYSNFQLKVTYDFYIEGMFSKYRQEFLSKGASLGFIQAFDEFKQWVIDNHDKAMNVELKKIPGGIDLDPAQMTMQVEKEGEDFQFEWNDQIFDAAQIAGVTFTIRTMTPVTNLPLILGLIKSDSQMQLS